MLDATTGQNAISQAKIFGDATGVTGVILTKLDGTAKGGVVIGIRSEFDLPVKLIGTGEAIDNMEFFDAKAFGKALFADEGNQKDEAETAEDTAQEEETLEIAEVQEEIEEIEEIQEEITEEVEEAQEAEEAAEKDIEETVEETVEEKPRKRGFFGWGGRKK